MKKILILVLTICSCTNYNSKMYKKKYTKLTNQEGETNNQIIEIGKVKKKHKYKSQNYGSATLYSQVSSDEDIEEESEEEIEDTEDEYEDDEKGREEDAKVKKVKVEFLKAQNNKGLGRNTKITNSGKTLVFDQINAYGYAKVTAITDYQIEDSNYYPIINLVTALKSNKEKNQLFRIEKDGDLQKNSKDKNNNKDNSNNNQNTEENKNNYNKNFSQTYRITQVKDLTTVTKVKLIAYAFTKNNTENKKENGQNIRGKKNKEYLLKAKKAKDKNCKVRYEIDWKNTLIGSIIGTCCLSCICCIVSIILFLGILPRNGT